MTYEVERAVRSARTVLEMRSALVAAGLVPASCRETGWYKYTRNGGTAKERWAGSLAKTIRLLAGGEERGPEAAWCGRWHRTVSSVRAEAQGVALYHEYANRVRSMSLLALHARIEQLQQEAK